MTSNSPSVKAGRLGKPHGLNGFLGLYAEPEDIVYFETGSSVWIHDRPYTVRAVRRADRGYQVAFREITDRTHAEQVRGSDVMVNQRRELESGEFWPDQLVGLEVRPTGGTIAEVISGPAQSRLRIQLPDGDFEIPFVSDLVPVVDLDAGFVQIVPIDGLTEPRDR